MDELYTESFFTRSAAISVKNEPAVVISQAVELKASEVEIEKPLVEIYETTHQMHFHLDQLEKAIFNEFDSASDFQFIFSKIRAKLKQKNTEGIYELLTDLEELLDLS